MARGPNRSLESSRPGQALHIGLTQQATQCVAIAGSANNVLARDEHGYALRQLGILYAPDYLVNAGSLINVADEVQGYSAKRAEAKVEGIYGAVRDIFHRAKAEGIPTSEGADRIASSGPERRHLENQGPGVLSKCARCPVRWTRRSGSLTWPTRALPVHESCVETGQSGRIERTPGPCLENGHGGPD
jgi:hypothetical protein